MKILATMFLALAVVSQLFAEPKDYETFCIDLMTHYEGVEFVSYEVYKQWNGDSAAFIKYYDENGRCYNE